MSKKIVAPGVGFGGIGEPRIYQGVDQKRLSDNWAEIQENEKIRRAYCERKGIDLSKLSYAEKLEVMDKALEWNKDLGDALSGEEREDG